MQLYTNSWQKEHHKKVAKKAVGAFGWVVFFVVVAMIIVLAFGSVGFTLDPLGGS